MPEHPTDIQCRLILYDYCNAVHSASGAAPELMYEGASVDSLIGKSFDLEHRLNEVLALLCLEDVADTPIGTGNLDP